MDSEKIDELAAIAYETYEQSLHCRSNWDGLYPTYKDAWRRVAAELINNKPFEDSMNSAWCYWTIEAGNSKDIGNSKYYKEVIITERERCLSKEWNKLFLIKMTMASEYANRLTAEEGVQWVTLTWKLGSK